MSSTAPVHSTLPNSIHAHWMLRLGVERITSNRSQLTHNLDWTHIRYLYDALHTFNLGRVSTGSKANSVPVLSSVN